MTWLEMLEKRICAAAPDSRIVVDTEAKREIAKEAIQRLRPHDGLTVTIDEEPAYPWWLEEDSEGGGDG